MIALRTWSGSYVEFRPRILMPWALGWIRSWREYSLARQIRRETAREIGRTHLVEIFALLLLVQLLSCVSSTAPATSSSTSTVCYWNRLYHVWSNEPVDDVIAEDLVGCEPR